MNIFSRMERAETGAFNFPKNKRNMPKPEAEAEKESKIIKAAENIRRDEKHPLNNILSNPRWITQALEQEETEKGKTLKENVRKASAIISKQTGYPEELIQKLYEIREKETRH